MNMKRVFLFLFAVLVFHIDTMAQTLTIEGNIFTLRLNDQDMTAEIYDSKFVIDDRPFPLNQKERKFNAIKAKKSQFLTRKSEEDPVVVTIPSKYTASNGKVYDITTIGKAAFAGYKNVDSYIIPASIVTIDDYAFFRSSITSVEIPASVKTIGKRVFGYCEKLKNIKIPNGLKCDNDMYRESKKVEVDNYLADNFTPLPKQGKNNDVATQNAVEQKAVEKVVEQKVVEQKPVAQKTVEQAPVVNVASADSVLAVVDKDENVPFEYVEFEGESSANVTSVQNMKTSIKIKNILVKMIVKKLMKKIDERSTYNGTYLSTTIQKGTKTKTTLPYNNSVMISERIGDKIKTTVYFPYIKKGYYSANSLTESQRQLEEMRKGTVEKTGETMIILGRKCEVYRVKYELKSDSAGMTSITNLHNEFAVCKDPSLPGADTEFIPGVKGVPLKFINNTSSQTTSEMVDLDFMLYIASTTTGVTPRKVDDSELAVPNDIKLVDSDVNPKAMLKIIDENTKYMKKNNLWNEKSPDEIKIYDNLQEDWEY